MFNDVSGPQHIYVAVIGDDRTLCHSFGRVLRAAHFQPITHPSAEAFLADTKRPQFDCLVTDVKPLAGGPGWSQAGAFPTSRMAPQSSSS